MLKALLYAKKARTEQEHDEKHQRKLLPPSGNQQCQQDQANSTAQHRATRQNYGRKTHLLEELNGNSGLNFISNGKEESINIFG
jgi:hypothetical protein